MHDPVGLFSQSYFAETASQRLSVEALESWSAGKHECMTRCVAKLLMNFDTDPRLPIYLAPFADIGEAASQRVV